MSGRRDREERREERLREERAGRRGRAPPAPDQAGQRRRLPGPGRGRGADRRQPEPDSGGDASNIVDVAGGRAAAERHPAGGDGARQARRQGEAARVRRPAVPGLQGLLRRSAAAGDRKPGSHRRSEARLPQLHDHRPAVDARRAPPRSPPANRAAAGTSSSSSTATRAPRTPATRPTTSSPRSPRAPGCRTSPGGTPNARASVCSARSRRRSRSRTARLHRHAVVRARRAGGHGNRSLGTPGSAGGLESAIEDAAG